MNRIISGTLLLFLFLLKANPSFAQETMLRINVQDERVFIYHNKVNLAGEGFNVYRSNGSGDFKKLNEQPVVGILYPEELPVALGETYFRIQKLLGTETASSTYFKLRTDKTTGRMATFLWPEVATALGRLFIDTEAPIGREVTYRIEFVDGAGKATGEVLEEKTVLSPQTIARPTGLSAENTGRQVTLQWKYPQTNRKNDDQVIQFHVYRKPAGGGNPEKLHEKILIRNNAQTTHQITFSAANIGQPENYYVTALDITGRESSPSQELRYLVEDNIAPRQLSGVHAFTRGQAIVVSWNMATEPDVAGYNLYRSERMNRGYKKINEGLLEPLQTVYADSSIRHGKNFSYKVSAVDRSGNEGERSLAVISRVSDTEAPGAVKNLSASFNGEAIELSWDPLPEGSSFRTYMVLRNVRGDGNTSLSRLNKQDLRAAAWTDKGVGGKGFREGAFYEYGIIAADSAGNFSDTTLTVIQVPDHTPPAAPGNLQATNEDGIRVSLRWNASSSSDVVSYRIYKQAIPSPQDSLAALPRRKRSFRDLEVEPGQKYLYAVTAIDSLQNESSLSYSDTVLVRDFDPPRHVRNVRAQIDEGQVKISWEPVVGFDLVGYNIYKADMATGKYSLLNEEILDATEWTDQQADAAMWYRVRAVDSSGNESKPSEPQQAKINQ